MIEPKPCPFCGWEKIRVIEDEKQDGYFKGSKFMYCWCKVCGARGPWAYNVGDDEKMNCDTCIVRWNERDGIQGMKREDFEKAMKKD